MTLTRETPTIAGKLGRLGNARLLRTRRTRWLHELVSVAGVVVVLEIVVFHEYFTGRSIPPWDFLGGYNTEAFAWWRDGSFFHPTQWTPYMWGGFPAAAELQNSSWYLPVGATSALTSFDLHASAVLSALHVGFGAVGMYLLGRRWGFARPAAFLGLTLWFFVSGYYAHAEHLDIMRGYAWMPWVLLIVSPVWPWTRWWAPPLAGLLLWQALLAMYPGALVASVYVLAVWVGLVQVLLRPRLREYLLPLGAAVLLAGSMTLLRFLPFALIRGVGSPTSGDSSVFSWTLLGTLFYPYSDGAIPNDITMRSFFLPVVAFALLGMATWRAPIARIAGASCVTAILLGFPIFPWSASLGRLPGMNLSRFRMDDFKVLLLAGMCVLAMTGAARIIEGVRTPAGRAPFRETMTKWHFAYLAALVTFAAIIGARGPFVWDEWLAQWSLIVAAVVLTVLACRLPRQPAGGAVVLLALISVCSGFLAITTTSVPWRGDRMTQEQIFGAPIDDLIKRRSVGGEDDKQRPPRVDPGPKVTPSDTIDPKWGGVIYAGRLSLLGYVNLRGSRTFDTVNNQLLDPSISARVRGFWVAPGIGLALADGELPSTRETARCIQDHECGQGAVVTPVDYSPATPLVYDVKASRPNTTLSFNEAYYPGWQAEVCGSAGGCVLTAVRAGTAGELRLDVPKGRSTVTLRYETPGLATAWFAFAGGVLGLLIWPIVGSTLRRRESLRLAQANSPSACSEGFISDASRLPDVDSLGVERSSPTRSGAGVVQVVAADEAAVNAE